MRRKAPSLTKIPPSRLIDAHLGQAIRARRKTQSLNQTALGERLGLSFQQIQKYERGANRIAASALYRLSEVLRCPLVAFFAGLTEPSSAGDEDRLTALGECSLRRTTVSNWQGSIWRCGPTTAARFWRPGGRWRRARRDLTWAGVQLGVGLKQRLW